MDVLVRRVDYYIVDLPKEIRSTLIFAFTFRKSQPLWQYEDITRTVWQVRSADQMDVFLQHVLQVFELSLPTHTLLAERWAQLSLQLALSCSSRHYAGRRHNALSQDHCYLVANRRAQRFCKLHTQDNIETASFKTAQIAVNHDIVDTRYPRLELRIDSAKLRAT